MVHGKPIWSKRGNKANPLHKYDLWFGLVAFGRFDGSHLWGGLFRIGPLDPRVGGVSSTREQRRF